MTAIKTEKGVKLFKGYINYRILTDPLYTLKTHYFRGITKESVKQLKAQFNNANAYHCFGHKVVRDHELETGISVE